MSGTKTSSAAGEGGPQLTDGCFDSPLTMRVFGQVRGVICELGRTPGAVDVSEAERWWVRPPGVRVLSQAGALEGVPGLWLRDLTVRDPHFAQIAELSALQHLNLYGCRLVSDAGLKELAVLGLESLELRGCVRLNGEGLEVLPVTLRELGMGYTRPASQGVRALVRLSALERLELAGCMSLGTDDLIHAFSGLGRLEALGLGSTSVTDRALAGLRATRRLRRLTLEDTAVTDAGLEHLAALPELESLNLRGCRIEGRGLAAFEDHKHLRRLCLASCSLSRSQLALHFPTLGRLELVDLRGCDRAVRRWARQELRTPGLKLKM